MRSFSAPSKPLGIGVNADIGHRWELRKQGVRGSGQAAAHVDEFPSMPWHATQEHSGERLVPKALPGCGQLVSGESVKAPADSPQSPCTSGMMSCYARWSVTERDPRAPTAPFPAMGLIRSTGATVKDLPSW